MTSVPVYLISRIPGADNRTVRWEDVFRIKRKVFIVYRPHREVSNHGVVPRERKFLVFENTHCHQVSSHYTLAAAEKAAVKLAKELAASVSPKTTHSAAEEIDYYDSLRGIR